MEFDILGLSQNETKAYEALLNLGRSTASAVSRESGVPYGRIYEVLASLETKGLVHIIPGKTKEYVPSSPKELKEYISKKRSILDKIEEDILSYESLYKGLSEEPVFVVKGRHNFKKVVEQMKKPKKFDYSVKYQFQTKASFLQDARRNKRKGISIKIIGRIDKETEKNVNLWSQIIPDIKPINNPGFAMSIRDEEVMLSIKEGHFIVLIKDKPFAIIMKQLFDSYYDNT